MCSKEQQQKMLSVKYTTLLIHCLPLLFPSSGVYYLCKTKKKNKKKQQTFTVIKSKIVLDS